MAQMGPKLSLNAADRPQTGTGTILLIARRASQGFVSLPPINHHLVAQNGATFSSPRGRKNYPPLPAPAEFDQDKRKGLVFLRRVVAQWRQGSREI